MVADDEAIEDLNLIPVFYMKALCKLSDEYGVAVPKTVRDAAQNQLCD
eukprot:CAMPEP_0204624210 /NCGR_PEP_ID=MMETSP0717-20131115/9967_1 /ASSEMBLY_ACC=CAM_ASM_000666 /TAXON_ID=230516 /ORGANISM="Chaetoceros curvisetus" /LENGTH=47 /DNA_ID= /DNA_START= /DNA_END= /DNA_ORIENTATION=